MWIGQFALAGWVAHARAATVAATGRDAGRRTLHGAVSNCLSDIDGGIRVGGSFVSLALNDITWLTFALLAALDRMTQAMVVSEPVPVLAAVSAPPAYPAYLRARGGRRPARCGAPGKRARGARREVMRPVTRQN